MDAFLTDHLIVENTGNENVSALDAYKLETIDYHIKGQKFTDTEEVTIPIDHKELCEYERVYIDFTIVFDSPSVAAVVLSESSCRYINTSANSNKVHVRLRLPRRTCRQLRIASTAGNISGRIQKIRFYGSNLPTKGDTDAEIDFKMPTKDTKIVRADYGFLGLKLTPGSHEITFFYQAPGLKAGILLSLMGWSLFLVGILVRRYRSL